VPGLAVLVEVHDEGRIATGAGCGRAADSAVNNRDLKTFQGRAGHDETSRRGLAPFAAGPGGFTRRRKAGSIRAPTWNDWPVGGAQAILVGESLIARNNIRAK